MISRSFLGRFRYLDVPPAGRVRPAGTLVFIHGFPLNPSMWDPQVAAMAVLGWRVIVPELRGFGEGLSDPPVTSIDDYAGDTIDLLDKLHVETAVVCGLSMGGYIAFSMFRHAPNYFRAMVLADTRSQGDTPEAVAGRKNMQQLARDKGAAAETACSIERGDERISTKRQIGRRISAMGLGCAKAVKQGP